MSDQQSAAEIPASSASPTPETGQLRTFAEFEVGQQGTLLSVAGPRLFRRRLLELGLVPGVTIKLVNVAPLGDPLEIEVRGCRFSIRRSEAAALQMRADSAVRHLRVIA